MLVHLQLLLPWEQTGVEPIDGFIRGGFLGVDLFFVLSGFLISALLLGEVDRTRSVRFGAFYARRALRLLPALYVLLAAHVVYAWITDLSWERERKTIEAAVFYVTNWQIIQTRGGLADELTHLWSLAIEEQFYLVWPVLLVAILGIRQRVRTASVVLAVVIAVVVVWRAHLWFADVHWVELVIRSDTRVDSLLVGALLATLWVRRATPVKGVDGAAWVALGVLVVCVATFEGPSAVGYLGGYTVFAVAAAVVILAILNGTWAGIELFDLAPLRAVGRVSYGLYLWHFPIFYAVAVHGQDLPDLARVATAVGLTATATWLSWVVVERPALRLKSRFGGHRPSEAAGARVPSADGYRDPPSDPGRAVPDQETDVSEPEADPNAPEEPRHARTESSNSRVRIGLIVVGVLIAGLVVGRLTAPDDDGGDGGAAGEDAEGLPFPHGDVNRTGYWGFAGLEERVIDTFDRADSPDALGSAGTGQAWEVLSGTWGIRDNSAVLTEPGGGSGPRLAVVPRGNGAGLTEVTMTVVEEGAGLVFRYRDPQNYWSVTANPGVGSWSATRVLDGEPELVGELAAPTDDGTTISVTQNETTVRFLVEGEEYLTINDGALADQLQGGLIVAATSTGQARWDRFLVMGYPPDANQATG
jgi:peptidoglycan/LPS O-acetylase OafA/YrhL